MATFETLGLSDKLLKAIYEIGYKTPTLIQQKAIPYVFMNRDIIACAQTGTGKTASFVLPIVDIFHCDTSKPKMPKAVILEPTRELAMQVAEDFDKYTKYVKMSKALVIGGVSSITQEKNIERGCEVVIATPGRFLDLINRGKLILSECKIVVIDEADRMMDMGFIPDVQEIVGKMPRTRQTIMFSATFPAAIQKIARTFLQNPKEIIIEPKVTTSKTIKQYVIKVEEKFKYKTLTKLLKTEKISNAIIFHNRKSNVDTTYRYLQKDGFSVGALHGDMQQSIRAQWLDKFKKNQVSILVCSDVAARGLDIPSVSHVFNMEVPTQSEDYVHRIGRTGRAGKAGISFTLVSKLEQKSWQNVLNIVKKDIQEFKFFNKSNPIKKSDPKLEQTKTTQNTDENTISPKKSYGEFGSENSVPDFLKNK